MELNRNQYFFMGVVLLLLGLQFRMVSSYVLNEETTRFLAQRSQASTAQEAFINFSSEFGTLPNKIIQPPDWLGWCVISVGAVLMLHSLAMPKPG